MLGYKKTSDETIISEITRFLNARDYSINYIEPNGKHNTIIHLASNHVPRDLELKIKRPLYDGVIATLTDRGEPYLCSKNSKYEFHFKKKTKNGEQSLLSYTQKKNSETEFRSFILKIIYGTKSIPLKKLYDIMPELKTRIEFRIIDVLSETILNTTTAARVINNFDEDAWYILAGGGASFIEINAEKGFSKKATTITSRLPQAIYAKLQESPRNTINQIVERRDVVSWERLLELTKEIAPKYGLTQNKFSAPARISKLEKLLLEDKNKFNEEIDSWKIPDEKFKNTVREIEPINYTAIRELVKQYIDFLDSKRLLKPNIEIEKTISRAAGGFAGKTMPEMRKNLSDEIRKVIIKPSKEVYLETIREVKRELEKNILIDTGIFLGKYPLAYIASSNLQVPKEFLLSWYIAEEGLKIWNAVGFERINNILRLNYIMDELNKDPTISGGADIENIFDSHISKVESATQTIGIGLGLIGQYYSKKTNGITNYVMDALSLGLLFMGIKKWYKYMNSMIERCERDIKKSAELINIDGA